MIKTWTHVLDLVLDLESLTKPLFDVGKEDFFTPRSFSSISEESEEEEKSKKSSENNSSSMKSIKSFSNHEVSLKKIPSHSENQENFSDKILGTPNLERISSSNEEIKENKYTVEITKTSPLPSTKTIFQNKLKRREVIQGKTINEYSLNSGERASIGSLDNIEDNHIFNEPFESPQHNLQENKIKQKEMLIKTKSKIYEKNSLKIDENKEKINIYTSLIDLLCGTHNNKISDLQPILDKKEEILFINEEMILEDDKEADINDEEEEILVLLSKNNRKNLVHLVEKIKRFFKKYPESSLFLNGFSANIIKTLTYILKILEIIMVSSLNILLISQNFLLTSEMNTYLIKFCCECLNYQFYSISKITIENLQLVIINVLDNILNKSDKVLCYIPFYALKTSENDSFILKSFLNFGNLNLIFGRKKLKQILNKYKNHADLENYSLEQQLFIISNKFKNMLRFIFEWHQEDIDDFNYRPFIKIVLKQNIPLYEEISSEITSLNSDFPIEKVSKIRYFQMLDIEFQQKFKDFNGYYLTKNQDIDLFYIKYLVCQWKNCLENRFQQFKKSHFTGKIYDHIKKKESKFKKEILDLQEKMENLEISLINLNNEETELRTKNEEISINVEELSKKIKDNEMKIHEIDMNIMELIEKTKSRREEILIALKGYSKYEEDFLANSFHKSETFFNIAHIFYILFKKTFTLIDSPMKKEYTALKIQFNFDVEEISLDEIVNLAIVALGNQEKFLKIFTFYEFSEPFPRKIQEKISSFEFENFFKGNQLQNYICELFENEVSRAKKEQILLIQKNNFINELKPIKKEFDGKNNIFEMNTNKLSKLPQMNSDFHQKKTTAERNLQKALKNQVLLENVFSNSKEILNLGFEQMFPYLSNEKNLDEFIFSLILYSIFILKYPSFFRKFLITKSESFFTINGEFHLLNYPLFYILNDYNCNQIESTPLSFAFLNLISIIDVMQSFPNVVLLIIDPNSFFFEFYKKKYSSTMIVEEFCEDSYTQDSIINALVQGKCLLIKNFSLKLLEMVHPIIDWNFIQLMNTNLKNLLDLSQNDEDSEAITIEIFQKQVKVHKNFRLILFSNNEEIMRTLQIQGVYNKFLLIFVDIEDKTLWEETFSLKLTEKFQKLEKKSTLEKITKKEILHFPDFEEIYQDFSQEIKKIKNIQELVNYDKIKNCYSLIKNKFFEDFAKILRNASSNPKTSLLGKDIKEAFRGIKKFIQFTSFKKLGLLLEIPDQQKYQSLVDFLHVIKLTNDSLVEIVGNIYSFSDLIYLEVLEHTLQYLKENNIDFHV